MCFCSALQQGLINESELERILVLVQNLINEPEFERILVLVQRLLVNPKLREVLFSVERELSSVSLPLTDASESSIKAPSRSKEGLPSFPSSNPSEESSQLTAAPLVSTTKSQRLIEGTGASPSSSASTAFVLTEAPSIFLTPTTEASCVSTRSASLKEKIVALSPASLSSRLPKVPKFNLDDEAATFKLIEENLDKWRETPSIFFNFNSEPLSTTFHDPLCLMVSECLKLDNRNAHAAIARRIYCVAIHEFRTGKHTIDQDANEFAERIGNGADLNSIKTILDAAPKYTAIAAKLDAGALFLLGLTVARDTWERRLPAKGPIYDQVMNLLIKAGVKTKGSKYNDVANQLIAHLRQSIQSQFWIVKVPSNVQPSRKRIRTVESTRQKRAKPSTHGMNQRVKNPPPAAHENSLQNLAASPAVALEDGRMYQEQIASISVVQCSNGSSIAQPGGCHDNMPPSDLGLPPVPAPPDFLNARPNFEEDQFGAYCALPPVLAPPDFLNARPNFEEDQFGMAYFGSSF